MGMKSNLKKTPKHSIEVAKLDIKFKKNATKLSSKNIDVSQYEVQLTKHRESMRTCLFEIHKAKKDLKNAMNNQKEILRQKIIEMKESYAQIKNDLKLLFLEMKAQNIVKAWLVQLEHSTSFDQYFRSRFDKPLQGGEAWRESGDSPWAVKKTTSRRQQK